MKVVGKFEQRSTGIVEHPDAWAAMKIVVAQNRITYFYNGSVADSCDTIAPMSATSKVKVGFLSSESQFSIKDVYLVEK